MYEVFKILFTFAFVTLHDGQVYPPERIAIGRAYNHRGEIRGYFFKFHGFHEEVRQIVDPNTFDLIKTKCSRVRVFAYSRKYDEDDPSCSWKFTWKFRIHEYWSEK